MMQQRLWNRLSTPPLAAVVDIDDEGLSDLVVGAPGEDLQKPTGAGRLYLRSGADGTLLQVSHFPDPPGMADSAVP